MLGSHDELIGESWVLIVVDHTGDESTEDIMALQALHNITVIHQVLEALHAIKDVSHAMVWVFLKVAHLKFTCKGYKVLLWDVI